MSDVLHIQQSPEIAVKRALQAYLTAGVTGYQPEDLEVAPYDIPAGFDMPPENGEPGEDEFPVYIDRDLEQLEPDGPDVIIYMDGDPVPGRHAQRHTPGWQLVMRIMITQPSDTPEEDMRAREQTLEALLLERFRGEPDAEAGERHGLADRLTAVGATLDPLVHFFEAEISRPAHLQQGSDTVSALSVEYQLQITAALVFVPPP